MMKAGILMIAMALLVPVTGLGHPATERYIPIGQSPSAPARVVYGEIQSVGAEHVIVVDGQSIKLGDATNVWLDNSRVSRRNTVGTRADCRAGRTVEVKLSDDADEPYAEWVKIRAEP